jgi:xanthine/CO dehydrogenase XdhC/CoxF family maturation factor
MLIRQSMSVQGAVSAGCLERDIIAHCEALKVDDRPLLLTYDVTSADELVFGLKLGCDGIVQVLLEPVGQSSKQLDRSYGNLRQRPHLLPQLLSAHGRVVAVTLFDLTNGLAQPADLDSGLAGAGLVMLETGRQTYELSLLPGSVSAILSRQARQALQGPDRLQSFVFRQEIDGYTFSALIEIVQPTTSLLVFGSGQDLDPLAKMAGVLGWPVTVMGNAQLDRLDCQQLVSWIGGQYVSAAIVMTHDYERDRKILQALFGSSGAGSAAGVLPYIGVVGPRRRADKLLAELALLGVPIDEEQLGRLFSPVGLDLGAERPEEIALSILAEIKAVLAGHRGGLLKEKQGPIHEPTRLKTADGVFTSGPEMCEKNKTAASTTNQIAQNHAIGTSCRPSDD